MRLVDRLALLAGMLAAFPISVCPRPISRQPDQEITKAADTEARTASQASGDAQGVLLAEAAVKKASDLRKEQTEHKLREAVELLQQSVRLFQGAHSFQQAADAELEISDLYFTLSQYKQSLKSDYTALALAGKDLDLRCRALSRIVRTAANIGQAFSGSDDPQQDLSRCIDLPAKAQAETLEGLGEVLQYSDSPKAVELLSQAERLFAQEGDDNGRAQSLLSRAYLRFAPDRAEAVRLATQALQLWTAIHNADGVAQAHAALGIFARITGDFETAQCNVNLALPVFQRIGDKENEATAFNAVGTLSRETGDAEAALEHHAHSRAVFQSIQDQLGVAEEITGMGNALIALGRYQELLPLFREKLQLARQTKNAVEAASAWFYMGRAYELEHHYARAEVLYSRSLAGYRLAHHVFGEGDVLIRLAHLRVSQGRYQQAIPLLGQAEVLKAKNKQMEELAKIYYELAYAYRKLNRLEDAHAAIEKTIDIIESQRLKINEFDSRASYFASVHRYYALYIQILMLLHAQHPESDFMQLAFEASEKSKVRALLDLLSASGSGLSCDELLQRQASEPQSDEATPPPAATSVLALQQIQEEIQDDGTVLLEYALGEEKSYVWVVDHTQIVAHELPDADRIRKLVQLLRNSLIARQPLPGESSLGLDEYHNRVQKADAAYQIYARKLSQLLLGPLDLSQAKRVLIVPDGSLQYIPFSALPLPTPQEPKAVFISQHEVVVLPSGSALSTLRKSLANRAPPTSAAAVFADPVFEQDDQRLHQVGMLTKKTWSKKTPESKSSDLKIAMRDAQESGYIPRLPGSQDEADAIGKALGNQDVLIRAGFDASRDYVLSGALNPYRIIHFATHGIIDAKHPEMSGLILSLISRSGERQDGYLRLGDIYKLKLSADLVVLSGCNSALGKDLESEGIIGLPRGFLYAGARSVIASLWKVDDASAAEFMKGFYARIKAGESPSSALRGAQLEMSRTAQWSAPFYWAAFVLQGDYK